MNRWQAAWTVFVKELVDALRDRRTLMVVLISSVAMGPLVLVLLSTLIDQFEKRAEAREIVVVGIDHAPTLRNYLSRQTYQVRQAPADWEERLRDNKLGDPVVVIPDGFESDLMHGEAPRVELVFSSSNGRAQSGVGRIERLLQGFVQERVTLRLIARGVAPSLLNVARVDEHDIADNAARAELLTGILPFFVLMAVVYGALNAALDTTAGERERGSLEPLLATPAARRSLVRRQVGRGVLRGHADRRAVVPQLRARTKSLAQRFARGIVPLRMGRGRGIHRPCWRRSPARHRRAADGDRDPLQVVQGGAGQQPSSSCSWYRFLPVITLFNQEGEASWHLWVPALSQMTLMSRALKENAPISLMDILPSLFICIVITIAALAFVSHQLTRRAAQ